MLELYLGDCLEQLQWMPSNKVQCCVTSPPYFGLRDYGHEGQIGLEQTPDEYVAKMVEVFREVRRVLRDDGTLWLNLGDSYAGAGPSGASYQSETTKKRAEMNTDGAFRISKTLAARGLTYSEKKPIPPPGLKKKDLIGIPWRVAFALQADGWYLRQDIIWHKPNPMPESVRDRCTKAHEYIFLLTKNERYYFDSEAMKEPATGNTTGRAATFDRSGNAVSEHVLPGQNAAQHRPRPQQARAMELAKKAGLTRAHFEAIRSCGVGDAGKAQHTQSGYGKNDPTIQALADEAKAALGGYYREFLISDTRNRRSVWSVATRPYKGAHFATYPPDLIEPCVLAGSRPGDIVLDPFGGSGTTAEVAISQGRFAWLCELNPEYVPLIKARAEIGMERLGL